MVRFDDQIYWFGKSPVVFTAHEQREDQPKEELEMDMYNNGRGSDVAQELTKNSNFSQENLEKEGLKKLRENNLKVIAPQGEVPEWKKY